jgi:hypothetical protein
MFLSKIFVDSRYFILLMNDILGKSALTGHQPNLAIPAQLSFSLDFIGSYMVFPKCVDVIRNLKAQASNTKFQQKFSHWISLCLKLILSKFKMHV